jgi:hypothetical protein
MSNPSPSSGIRLRLRSSRRCSVDELRSTRSNQRRTTRESSQPPAVGKGPADREETWASAKLAIARSLSQCPGAARWRGSSGGRGGP